MIDNIDALLEAILDIDGGCTTCIYYFLQTLDKHDREFLLQIPLDDNSKALKEIWEEGNL